MSHYLTATLALFSSVVFGLSASCQGVLGTERIDGVASHLIYVLYEDCNGTTTRKEENIVLTPEGGVPKIDNIEDAIAGVSISVLPSSNLWGMESSVNLDLSELNCETREGFQEFVSAHIRFFSNARLEFTINRALTGSQAVVLPLSIVHDPGQNALVLDHSISSSVTVLDYTTGSEISSETQSFRSEKQYGLNGAYDLSKDFEIRLDPEELPEGSVQRQVLISLNDASLIQLYPSQGSTGESQSKTKLTLGPLPTGITCNLFDVENESSLLIEGCDAEQPAREVTVIVINNGLTNSKAEFEQLNDFANKIEADLIAENIIGAGQAGSVKIFTHTENKLLDIYQSLKIKVPNASLFQQALNGALSRVAITAIKFPDFTARVLVADESVVEVQAAILDYFSEKLSPPGQTQLRSADLLYSLIVDDLKSDKAVLLVPYSKGSATTNLAIDKVLADQSISDFENRLDIVAVAPTTATVALSGLYIVEDDDAIVTAFGGPKFTHDNGDVALGTDIFTTTFGLKEWIINGFGHSLSKVYAKDESITEKAILERVRNSVEYLQYTD